MSDPSYALRTSPAKTAPMHIYADPQISYHLAAWPPARRKQLRQQFDAGDLSELTFDAVVFRSGPNGNHVRFKDEDLSRFADSFAGQPFLRNHNTADIGARDGTILASRLEGAEFVQQIQLTTQRGILNFLEGIIDRFSIGWYYDDIDCSICHSSWMTCPHMPGRKYQINGRSETCEIIFVNPSGKETSAVNAPAIRDTHILAQLSMQKEMYQMSEEVIVVAPEATELALPAAPAGHRTRPDGGGNGGEPGNQGLAAEVRRLQNDLQRQRNDHQITQANLSPNARTTLRQLLSAWEQDTGQVPTTERVTDLVEQQRNVEAIAVERNLVRGVRSLDASQMTTPHDRFQAALNWVFGLHGSEPPPPGMRNIRDLYHAITGDFEYYGRFHPEYSQLATATTTTLAGMVVNALNRVTLQYYNNMATYRWYEAITSVTPHDGSTQNIRLLTLDGIANLSTVAEGAAYTEASVGDADESMTFTKRGNFVGITLEAIRRADIQLLQAIPRELVKAAVRTRSAAVSAIFTTASGAGPTLGQDSLALFHATHGNLATVALTTAEWSAARSRIWEQVVPGTSKPLGLWPTFVLVPIELYDAALEMFGYGAGDVGKPSTAGTAQTVNPYGESRVGDPRPIPIPVPDWTDANDWAYIVDPRLHPVIHMAYANAPQGGSHPMPEIFEVVSETQGLMFTNDTLPVKVRDWWTVGVSTYVGVGKNNVT